MKTTPDARAFLDLIVALAHESGRISLSTWDVIRAASNPLTASGQMLARLGAVPSDPGRVIPNLGELTPELLETWGHEHAAKTRTEEVDSVEILLGALDHAGDESLAFLELLGVAPDVARDFVAALASPDTPEQTVSLLDEDIEIPRVVAVGASSRAGRAALTLVSVELRKQSARFLLRASGLTQGEVAALRFEADVPGRWTTEVGIVGGSRTGNAWLLDLGTEQPIPQDAVHLVLRVSGNDDGARFEVKI